MSSNGFPSGWDEKRIQRVLAYYEQQTEEEAVAEDEAAFEREDQTFIQVPCELVPQIRDLIAQQRTTASVA